MGEHKERTGKTRVGVFLKGLKNVSPTLLDLASNVPGLNALGDVADMIKGDPVMSENEKAQALALVKLDKIEMQEITKRWESDMTSDNLLSKTVRPLALIFLTLFMTFIVFTDSKTEWNFDVKESYITLLETLLLAVYLAYFGSRGIEKYKKIGK